MSNPKGINQYTKFGTAPRKHGIRNPIAPGVTLFHGTTDANAESIVRQGIRKSPKNITNPDFSKRKSIYLATTRKEAAHWAAFASGGKGGSVLKVRIPLKHAVNIKPDPNYTFGSFVNKDKKTFSRNIPKSWVKK